MPKRTTTRQKIIRSITAFNIVIAVLGMIAGVIFLFADQTADQLDTTIFFIGFGTSAVFYSVLSLLILARYPRHVVGWLFLTTGLLQSVMVFGSALEDSLADGVLSIVVNQAGVWIAGLFWAPAMLIPLTFVLQYFPNGRLPSRRWWPLPALTFLFMVFLGLTDFTDLELIGIAASLLGIVVILGSLAAAVVHLRRAQGVERLQMKWLVYTAVITITTLVSASLILGGEHPVNSLFIFIPSLLAVVMGFAILRYRLFDIDIIIRKTLVYGVLTALLAVLYFGSVVLIQPVIGRITDAEQSTLAIVLSTLFIAALFSPLRRRLQDFIDRRFYRRRYDAEQVLAAFARTARDETNLDRLTAELVQVVQQTMQPQSSSLWFALEKSREQYKENELTHRNPTS